MRTFSRALFALALTASTLPALASAARAAELTGLDGMTATVIQEHQSSFSGLGLRGRVHPASLISNVELLPFVEWWRNTSSVQPFDVRATRSDATVGVDSRFVGEFKGFHPYAGVGFGLHFIHNEVEAPTLGLAHGENSLIKGGPAVLGGATFAIGGRLENFFELKYHYLPSYSQLKINMGLAWNLK